MANNAVCFQPVYWQGVGNQEGMAVPCTGMPAAPYDGASVNICMFPTVSGAQQMGFPCMLPCETPAQGFDNTSGQSFASEHQSQHMSGMQRTMQRRFKQGGPTSAPVAGLLPEEVEEMRRAVRETEKACLISQGSKAAGHDPETLRKRWIANNASAFKLRGAFPQQEGAPDAECDSEASTCSSAEPVVDPVMSELPGIESGSFQPTLDWVLNAAWGLTLTKRGCLIVQKALEVGTAAEQQQIALKLQGHVREAMTSPHANFVLQKSIEVLPAEQLQFVINELQGDAAELAKHRFGCRIFQRLIENCPPEQMDGIISELLVDCAHLCRNQFGNFVIQHILQHGSAEQKSVIAGVLSADSMRFAKHRIASHVVSCALANCALDDVWRMSQAVLAEEEQADPGRSHGSFVVREMQQAVRQLGGFHGRSSTIASPVVQKGGKLKLRPECLSEH